MLMLNALSGLLPSDYASIQAVNMSVSQAYQGFSSDSTHPPAAAIQDEHGILIRQFVQVLGDLVIRNGKIGVADIAFEGNMHVHQGEILISQHGLKLIHANIRVIASCHEYRLPKNSHR